MCCDLAWDEVERVCLRGGLRTSSKTRRNILTNLHFEVFLWKNFAETVSEKQKKREWGIRA